MLSSGDVHILGRGEGMSDNSTEWLEASQAMRAKYNDFVKAEGVLLALFLLGMVSPSQSIPTEAFHQMMPAVILVWAAVHVRMMNLKTHSNVASMWATANDSESTFDVAAWTNQVVSNALDDDEKKLRRNWMFIPVAIVAASYALGTFVWG